MRNIKFNVGPLTFHEKFFSRVFQRKVYQSMGNFTANSMVVFVFDETQSKNKKVESKNKKF
jgi:hypothetical protein